MKYNLIQTYNRNIINTNVQSTHAFRAALIGFPWRSVDSVTLSRECLRSFVSTTLIKSRGGPALKKDL